VSDNAADLLESLLSENGLTASAKKVGDAMVRFKFGSATVVAAISGDSLVITAPIFKALPSARADEFCRHLLGLNARMAGLASFGLGSDGSVSLMAGRSTDGLDAREFKLVLSTVGKFADAFDDLLHDEYYGTSA